MIKDFDNWNIRKKDINNSIKTKLYNTRDVWWCSLGVNVGFEQDGNEENFERPVLIIKGLSKNTCLIAPLTKSKNENRYRLPIGLIDGNQAHVIISQIKVIDTKRFINKIGVVDKITFEKIRKSIKNLI
jgi:mRNA interferase MazF